MQQEHGVSRADSEPCQCQPQIDKAENESDSISNNHQNIIDMKAEIESIVCNWADEIPYILVRIVNAITLSANEEELRAAVKRIAEETELDKFFAYGYGAHHFWLTHRRLSNGEPKEHRLLVICTSSLPTICSVHSLQEVIFLFISRETPNNSLTEGGRCTL